MKFKDFFHSIKKPTEYLYHGTSRANLDSIKERGLGTSSGGAHLTPNEKYAEKHTQKQESGVMLRVAKDKIGAAKTTPEGTWHAPGGIKAKHLEYKHEDGSWRKL